MTKKNRKPGFIIGIAVALVLPLSIYALAKALKKDRVYMPPYYEQTGNGIQEVYSTHGTPSFLKMPDFKAVNQVGDSVSLNESLPYRTLLIGFFFTQCPGPCPRLMQNMHLIQNAFRPDPKNGRDTISQLIMITVNPEHDSVPVLFQYAQKHDVNNDRWWLLRGDKTATNQFARQGLHVVAPGDQYNEQDFVHTQKLVLVDQERYIRGYYDGLDSADLHRCADDMGRLYLEKKH